MKHKIELQKPGSFTSLVNSSIVFEPPLICFSRQITYNSLQVVAVMKNNPNDGYFTIFTNIF